MFQQQRVFQKCTDFCRLSFETNEKFGKFVFCSRKGVLEFSSFVSFIAANIRG